MDFALTICILLALVLCSGFFSGSETAMMSLNRYKLNHLVKQKNKAAKRSLSLISRPDKLLGTILVGNTFANIIASAILTSYATFKETTPFPFMWRNSWTVTSQNTLRALTLVFVKM